MHEREAVKLAASNTNTAGVANPGDLQPTVKLGL